MLSKKIRIGTFLFLLNTALSAETVLILSRTGLYARLKPEKSAESLALIPFGTELKVAAKTKIIAEIDGISSPWLKITYGSVTGWIFGGYTAILNDGFRNSQQTCTNDIAAGSYVYYKEDWRDFVDEIYLEFVKDNAKCRFRLNNGPDIFEYPSANIECSEAICEIFENGSKKASYRIQIISKRLMILKMTPVVTGVKESYTYREGEAVFPNNTVFIRK